MELLNLFFYVGAIFAGMAMGYGITLIQRWRTTWPSQRYFFYMLTFFAALSFGLGFL
jgi:hypothetical protein